MDISRKRTRERLKRRREPYWQRLDEGCYLGFRRGPDSWHARYRGRDKVQKRRPLKGIVDFDEAKRAAELWIGQMSGTAVRSPTRGTVRAALDAYLADLRSHGRTTTATEAAGRFRKTVYKDALASLPLESATREDFAEWRDRLREGRQPRSINRQVRSVVAALNFAVESGHVGNRSAWHLKPLQDDKDDDGEPAIFLSPEQRAALLKAATSNAARFLRGLELTGARPSELAATTVADFDGKQIKFAHRKGKPPKLRVRYTVLGPDGVEFFEAQAADKLPGAPLFTEDGQQPWRRHVWAREIRAAVKAHNEKARGRGRLPPEGVSAYTFRHARISELLQVHGVDPLTVAAQTGTSVQMIERNYLKFIPAAMAAKLASVKSA